MWLRARIAAAWFLLLVAVGWATASSDTDKANDAQVLPIERAVQVALNSAQKIPNYSIRGLKATFIPDGAALLKGYRGRTPSPIKEKRPYWDVILDYYKEDSTTPAFGSRIVVDALTGEHVR